MLQIYFDTILSITYVKEMPYLNTHTSHTLQCFIWGCKIMELKRGRQKGLGRKIQNNFWITLKLLIFPILNYLKIQFFFGIFFIYQSVLLRVKLFKHIFFSKKSEANNTFLLKHHINYFFIVLNFYTYIIRPNSYGQLFLFYIILATYKL